MLEEVWQEVRESKSYSKGSLAQVRVQMLLLPKPSKTSYKGALCLKAAVCKTLCTAMEKLQLLRHHKSLWQPTRANRWVFLQREIRDASKSWAAAHPSRALGSCSPLGTKATTLWIDSYGEKGHQLITSVRSSSYSWDIYHKKGAATNPQREAHI